MQKTLDARGMRCPIPVLRATKELKKMASGDVLEILASDSQAPRDFTDYCQENGHELLSNTEGESCYVIILKKG